MHNDLETAAKWKEIKEMLKKYKKHAGNVCVCAKNSQEH